VDADNARAIKFEAEYWRLVLEDIKEVSREVGKIGEATNNLLTVASRLASTNQTEAARIIAAVSAIQESTYLMVERITSVAELSDGRARFLKGGM
jgi:hypothetical protein